MQDGKSASLTAPNGLAQEQLLRAALADAGVSAEEVSCIEAHGTGTKLGDPIEVEAIANVYGGKSSSSRTSPLYVSSVKANVGHLEAAAGMAGLLSLLASLGRGCAAPNAQLHMLNGEIGRVAEQNGLSFITADARNAVELHSKVAAVSSFGYSGTIVHCIVDCSCASTDSAINNNNHIFQYPAKRYPFGHGHGLLHVVEVSNIRNTIHALTRLHSIPWPHEDMIALLVQIAVSTAYHRHGSNSELEEVLISSSVLQLDQSSSLVSAINNESQLIVETELERRSMLRATVNAVSTTYATDYVTSKVRHLKNEGESITVDETVFDAVFRSANGKEELFILGNYNDEETCISQLLHKVLSFTVMKMKDSSTNQEAVRISKVVIGAMNSHPVAVLITEDNAAVTILNEQYEAILSLHGITYTSSEITQAVNPLQAIMVPKIAKSWSVAEVEAIVMKSMSSNVSNFTSLNPNQSLVEFGLDSFASTAIAAELSQKLQIALSLSLLLEAASVNDLVETLLIMLDDRHAKNANQRVDSSDVAVSVHNDEELHLRFDRLITVIQHIPEDTRQGTIVLFPSLGHHCSAWLPYLDTFARSNLQVLAVNLPGRYNREDEAAFETLEEIITAITSDATLLEQSGNIFFLAHSFGTCLAVEVAICLQQLAETNNNTTIKVSQVISIAGISAAYLQQQPLYAEDAPVVNHEDEESLKLIEESAIAMYGQLSPLLDRTSKQFNEKSLRYCVQDMRYTQQWVALHRQRHVQQSLEVKLSCAFAWLTGNKDRTSHAPHDQDWSQLVSGRFERLVYSGDHFFLFQTTKKTQQIMEDCVRTVQRQLALSEEE